MRDSELQRLRLDEVDRTPLYLLAYRRLRELIASGAFAPGEKLMSEAKLAEAMGVGRTSLRTALVLLQEDGYVSTRHGSGTFVTQRLPSPEDAAPAACLTVRERLERLHLPLQVQPGPVRLGQRDDFLDSQLEAGGESLAMVPAAYFLDGQLAVESQLYACERVARSLARAGTALSHPGGSPDQQLFGHPFKGGGVSPLAPVGGEAGAADLLSVVERGQPADLL